MTYWKYRLKAASIHFCASFVIVLFAALLVFLIWYPGPYSEISGGRELFLLVGAVDVTLGPLMTFVIFSWAKPLRELRRDVIVVCLLQLGGLGYGLWTVFVARPVHLVFEIDRFRIIHAIDVPHELIPKMPRGIEAEPLFGPTLLAVRPFASSDEEMEATLAALQGVSLSSRPDLWQFYETAKPRVLHAAKLLPLLLNRFPAQATEIQAIVLTSGRGVNDVLWLPMVGRKSFWTVLVDSKSAEVIGFLPIDSF